MIENFGLGTDIVEIKKFKKLNFSDKKSFYEKIFTKSEIEYCRKFKDDYRHFAGKFAVKEAVIKSINTKIHFLDIITSNKKKKPKVKILKNDQYLFQVSVSHEEKFAVAVVISEIKSDKFS